MILGETQFDTRIAIKLPACSTATLLHSINTYFIGKFGVTPGDWAVHAAFIWSLLSDSNGVPGSILDTPLVSLVGELPALQFGGWFRQSLDWWLPSSRNSGAWLVGSWPATARDVMMLGVDSRPATAEVLLGYVDGTGLVWVPLSYNGLMASVDLLHTQAPAGSAASGTDTFKVIREVLLGSNAPVIDTSVLAPGSALIWQDSTVLTGQTVRYTIAAPCSTGTSAAVQTSEIRIPAHWPVHFTPDSVFAQIQTPAETLFHATVSNSGPIALSIRLAPAPLEMIQPGCSKQTPPVLAIVPSPDSFVLPGGATQNLTLSIPAINFPTGTYGASLTARVDAGPGSQIERRAFPVRLDFDIPTSVHDTDSPDSITEARPRSDHNLAAAAHPNPFGDNITLEWDYPKSDIDFIGNSYLADAQGDAAYAQVIVYNSLGNKIKRVSVPVGFFENNGTIKASVTIDGTAAWASGVYFVSVQYQSRTSTVKLLHLK